MIPNDADVKLYRTINGDIMYSIINEMNGSSTPVGVKCGGIDKSSCEPYKSILEKIRQIIDLKNKQYTEDPIETLSLDDLLTQIKIKAVRAQLTNQNDIEKLLDEMFDTAIYDILAIAKVIKSNQKSNGDD